MVCVVLTPRPFAGPEYMTQPAGRTVRAMLVEAVRDGTLAVEDLARAELHVDGVMIPRDTALDHVLDEGQVVNVVVYAHGGGGGGGKDVGQVLLQVAVIAVSMWVGGGAGGSITNTLFAKVAAAAVMVGGNMAISAMYAPKASAEKANDRYALQSASNSYRQWGPMPLVLGESVVAPDLAVKTFTRAIGDDVWIYGILAHHYGPCRLDELKIGDTLVSSMGAADAKFVHHLSPGARTFTLVPNDINQTDLAPEELTATPSSATPVVRAAEGEGQQFEIDLYLPGGLYFQKDDGRKITASVTVTVRYRPINAQGAPTGSGVWQSGMTIPLSGSSKDPLRITRSLNLPLGRYEFELTRSRLEDTNEKRHTDVAWSAVRAIAFRKPVTDEVLSISEFAIRATALNQGSLAPITARITPICETWTGTAWGPPVPTSNPAALTRWLLTGPAPAKPLTLMQADQGLRAWSQLCDQYGWKAHVPVMEARSQSEVLALLERAGRASIFWDGTQTVATCWVEKPVPKQMFTGVNLKDHRFEIAYPDPVHAFRVEFANLEQAGEPDEVMVYNDGYAETTGVDAQGRSVKAATLIEALRLEDGQKTRERAIRDGRWEMGRRKHQRRFDTWSADIEAVVCRYGDRVRLAWQRAGGEGGARVRLRRLADGAGSLVTGLRLDREIEMEPGVDYVVDLRLVNQLIPGVPVVNVATSSPVATREIQFVTPRSAALSPRRADLIAFGPAEDVTEDVEIVGLEPGEGLTANLTGVRYVAPLLMAGETGPIPDLPSRLSGDRRKDPPAPSLLGVDVSEQGVRVGFSMPPWRGSPITGFSARWRSRPEAGETVGWSPLPDLGAGSMTLTTPPLKELPGEDEVTRVQIELRAMTAAGQVSDPLTTTVVLPTVSQPQADQWSLEARPVAADGSRQPVLVVSGSVADPAVASVSIQYGLTAAGPWTAEFSGPPPVVAYEIKGLTPGLEHHVLVTYYSAQGVAGRSLVLGPCAAPGLIAGDTTHLNGEPVAEVIDRLIGVEGLAEANEEAARTIASGLDAEVDARERLAIALGEADAEIRASVTAEAAARGQLKTALEAADQGIRDTAAATKAALEQADATIRASVAAEATARGQLKTDLEAADKAIRDTAAATKTALEAADQTIRASVAAEATARGQLKVALEDADASLRAKTVELDDRIASAFDALGEGADGKLGTRIDAVEQRASTLETDKASVTDLNAVRTRVTTAEGTLTAQNTRLTTAETNIAGKASNSDFQALKTEVTTARGSATSLNNRLNTTDTTIAGKASAQSVTDLVARVTGAENENAAQNTRISSAETEIGKRALVTDLSALSGRVTTAQSDIAATNTKLNTVEATANNAAKASDLNSLTTRVTNAEGVNTAQNTRLSTVETDVAGKASSQSVTDLSSSVSVRNRTFRQNAAPTSPAGGYPLVAGDTWINTTAGQNNAISVWTGTAWASAVDPRIAISASGVTDLTAKIGNVSGTVADALAGKAGAQSVTDLAGRVTTAESDLSATKTKLSSVEATANAAAKATDLTALSGRVTTAQSDIAATNTKLSSVETTANASAKASDLNALQTRVTNAEGVNTAQNTRLNTVETDVAGKASAQSVSDLSSSVVGLTTRVGATETATADLRTGKADASRVTSLEAQARQTPGANLITKGVWTDATVGPWINATSVADDGPPGLGRKFVMRTTATDSGHGDFQPGSWAGRKFRATGWVKIPTGTSTVGIGVFGQNATGSNVNSFAAVTAPNDTWTAFDLVVTAPVNMVTGRPFVRANAPFGVLWSDLRMEDITEARTVDDKLTGVTARVGTVETATADLRTGKADASRVATLEARTTDLITKSLPSTFEDGSTYFTTGDTGNTWTGFTLIDTDKGKAWKLSGSTFRQMRTKGAMTAQVGRTYRTTAIVKNTTADATVRPWVRVVAFTAAGAKTDGPGIYATGGTDWETITATFKVTNAAHVEVRPEVILNYKGGAPGNTVDAGGTVALLLIEDITDAVDIAATNTKLSSVETTANNAAKATDLTALSGRVTTAQNDISSQNTRLSTVETGLNGKASAQSVTDLTTRVTNAEGVNTTQNTRLSTVETTANNAAKATDLTALQGRVTTAEGALTAQNTKLNTVEATANAAAKATDLNALTTRVTNAESDNTAQNTRLNTVETDVAGKASSQSVADLSSSVSIRNRTFRQNAAPTSPAGGYPLVAGDTWINTTAGQNNALSIWTGAAWASAVDPRIATSATGVTDLTAKIGNVTGTVADALAGKASAQSVTDLAGRVTTAQSDIAATNTKLSTVETTANNAAKATDLTALQGRVTTAEGSLSAQNTRLNTVETGLNGKASAQSVTDLTSTVNTKPQTFAQAAAPGSTGRIAGDLWVNTSANNQLNRWSGTAWVAVHDVRGADALAELAAARNGAANLNAQLQTMRQTTTDGLAGKVATTDFTALTTRVTNAESVNTAQNTRLNTAEADIAGKASAQSVTNLNSTVNGLSGRMTTVETTTANLQTNKAEASRVTQLEVSNRSSMNTNSDFAQPGTGTASQVMPTGWIDQEYGWRYTIVPGVVSANALRYVTTANENVMMSSYGRRSTRPGYFVLRAVVKLVAGSFGGAGVHTNLHLNGQYQNNNAASLSFQSELGDGEPGRVYTVEKLVLINTPMDTIEVFAMTNWDGLGARSAKTIEWHECSVREATEAEIKSGGGVTNDLAYADATTGILPFRPMWGGASGGPPNMQRNDNGSVAVWKTGGGTNDGGGVSTLASVEMMLGTEKAREFEGAIRVYKGERFCISTKVVAQSGTRIRTSNMVIPRLINLAKTDLIATDASPNGPLAPTNYITVGAFIDIPEDGYLGCEIYMRVEAASTAFGDMALFQPALNRVAPGVTAIPAWRKPGTADTPNAARLSMIEQVISKAGNLKATWAVAPSVPGANSFIRAQAENADGTPTSDVGIGAKTISLYNPQGDDWRLAMLVQNGNAVFTGGLQAGAYIRLGNGQGWPVALRPVDFDAADGAVVNFGTDLGGLPALSFAMNNLAPLNAGETYDVRAENLTPTGFTMRAKINVPGATGQQTITGTGTQGVIGSVPMRYFDLGSKPESSDGTYYLMASGSTSFRVPPRNQMMDYEGFGSVSVYVKKNGSWSRVGFLPYSWWTVADNPSSSNITAYANWTADGNVQLGSGVQAIAIGMENPSEGLQRTASLSTIGPFTWQSQAAGSSVRSATPNGQKTRVTVRPQ